MNLAKVTLLLLVITLAYLAVAESRRTGNVARKDYRLFQRERQPRYPYGHGRQHRDDYYRNDKEKDEKDENDDNDYGSMNVHNKNKKKKNEKVDDDYEDIDDDLNNIDLDEANRILFFLKQKVVTTTQAPIITTTDTETEPPAEDPPETTDPEETDPEETDPAETDPEETDPPEEDLPVT